MADGLLAIRYERGKLELLDQRLLPFETTYTSVASPDAAYDAIKSMVVRGAPAIGCTAALATAAWLAQYGGGAQFKSAAEAAEVIQRELDHLVTSRPTAVNLQDACQALLRTARAAAAAEGASPQDVTEAVIGAAEAYFHADIATCKAIGGHGADALLAAAKAAGRGEGGRLRVLTHCNTGALATAAFGTALGVVRALAARGQLQHTYCTETRPYNQGSRLTAYELVQEGLPATLIADSAAAALMAAGRVDAVVVGADRIAANGDTANKIGTYSLAVNAAQHRIPFFTAAPLTTVDVDTADGADIQIEQRSSEELTHFRGQRVAAEGIGTWNPSFDVTPAHLIAGIITEHGLVPKAGKTFSVTAFAHSRGISDRQLNGAAAPTAADGTSEEGARHNGAAEPQLDGQQLDGQQSGFVALDEASLVDFIAAKPHLAERLGGAASKAKWKVKEVGDGNINYVYILEGPAGSLCLKQGHPYVRIMKSWKLSQDRVRIEAEVLAEEGRHAPEHVPAMLDYDGQMFTIAMAYIGPPAVMLRLGLNAGNIYPKLAQHMGAFCARTLYNTSLLALSSTQHRELVARFANDEMCRITEALIFQEPYSAAEAKNKWTSPHLDSDVKALQADEDARAAAGRLQAMFTERRQALLHGDLHTGSLLVTPDSTHVIDGEFGFVGPIAFDVGKFIGNLFIAFFASDGHASKEEHRSEQRTWLLRSAVDTWNCFSDVFLQLWGGSGPRGDVFPPSLFTGELLKDVQQRFMRELLTDALGFGGAVIIRRLVGMAHTVDMDAIQPPETRAVCERRALRFAWALLVGAVDFRSIEDVAAFADKTRQDGADPMFPLS